VLRFGVGRRPNDLISLEIEVSLNDACSQRNVTIDKVFGMALYLSDIGIRPRVAIETRAESGMHPLLHKDVCR